MNKKQLEKFSALVLKKGVNLQKGQGLEISCPIERADFARVMASVAYRYGAKIVRVRYNDEIIDKISYENATTSDLSVVPKWLVSQRESLVKENFCYVALSAENPSLLKNIPADKLLAVLRARSLALKKYSDAVMSNQIRWCVVSLPTKEWAKAVFPNQKNAVKLLENAIIKTMRLDEKDPVLAWENHVELLNKRAKILNESKLKYLHFTSSNGTDLKVGLAKNHVFISAEEKAKDNVNFIANMPTEEIFTAPNCKFTEGVAIGAKPLSYNGQIIDGFKIEFKNGKAVSYSAKVGEEALKNLIKTDKGTCRLGEVALIDNSSPVNKTGILFFNTLFDENASCHLAFGKGYPTTVKGGEKLSAKELKELGVNDSSEHVDFMIGSLDITCNGYTENGQKISIIENGAWVI